MSTPAEALAGGAGARPDVARSEADAAPPAGIRAWWALAALLLLAGVLRLSTIDLQSFWYDEAYTPVHVLHPSLGATLHTVVHTENNPPLYYLLAWVWSRAFGTGEVALRSLSALAGIATVGVAWAIGLELASRRVAVVLAALVAVNPLFVWYSQEARAYALFALMAAVSFLFFVRALARPSAANLGGWALASVLALLSHYFAVFLLAPEALALLAPRLVARLPGRERRAATLERGGDARARRVLAVGAVAVAGLALVPLVVAQGGHGTQWIGRWALSSRLIAIPQYYLLGTSAAPLGHGLLLASGLLVLASLALVGRLGADELRSVVVAAGVGAVAIAVPLALAVGGADYLAPRNLVGAWIPLTAALAVLLGARAARVAGVALASAICAAGVVLVIDVDASPRLQRGDWRGLAHGLRAGPAARAYVTPQLGSAPLEYYLPLRQLPRGSTTRAQEVDVIGFKPFVHAGTRPPAPGFALVGRGDVHGLLVFRFRAARPLAVSERALSARGLDAGHTETLVPATRANGAR